ncbi:MAG: thioredoxin [Chloroflexota bacterium]|nr:MAG: thioredoxin [Chloroflexota bacterium]
MGKLTFEVTGDNFQAEVLDSDTPVLVDFWAEWCGPCKMIGPIVDEIAAEYQGRLRVGKLDADQYGDILMQYQIMGIPTLLLFKGGEVVERIVGYQPKDRITGKLTGHLN